MRSGGWFRCALFLLAACSAPPMTLTKELYRPHESSPVIVPGKFHCDVDAVRARLDEPPAARALAVDVTFPAAVEQQLPPHLQAYARSDQPSDQVSATFALRPADERRRWPEDYVPDAAVRLGLSLRVQDARYFADGEPAAEVIFTGTARADAVAQPVAPGCVPTATAASWPKGPLPTGLAAVMRAVRRHPWAQVLGRARDTRCDPVAWLGPGDEVLAHEDIVLLLQPWRSVELRRAVPSGLRADDCALLLRLVDRAGQREFCRVPLALLREGDDLVLHARQGGVEWTRREIWRARILADAGETASWPSTHLRLAHTRIPYGFDAVHRPVTWPGGLLRAVLSPLAWTVDLLAWTNPVLQKIIEALVDEPQPITPVRSGR
jgi:hypothetical protein